MTEPIDNVRPVPRAGWPKALLRLELLKCTAENAFYELACASRHEWRGVIAVVGDVDLAVFPHQSVDEIARGLAKMRKMAVQG